MEAHHRSLRAIEWSNFFLADVQTGLGPFLAASGWRAGSVGYALTFGGLVTVAMQTPAGAIVDAIHRKRALLAASLIALVAGAVLLMTPLHPWTVYSAQTLAAIALAAFALLLCAVPETLGRGEAHSY